MAHVADRAFRWCFEAVNPAGRVSQLVLLADETQAFISAKVDRFTT